MSYYRDVYLQSDHWKNLRLERLVKDKGRCSLCGRVYFANDVHHVKYGSDLKQVRKCDLRTLCRDCHDKVHLILKYDPIRRRSANPAAIMNRVKQHMEFSNRRPGGVRDVIVVLREKRPDGSLIFPKKKKMLPSAP